MTTQHPLLPLYEAIFNTLEQAKAGTPLHDSTTVQHTHTESDSGSGVTTRTLQPQKPLALEDLILRLRNGIDHALEATFLKNLLVLLQSNTMLKSLFLQHTTEMNRILGNDNAEYLRNTLAPTASPDETNRKKVTPFSRRLKPV